MRLQQLTIRATLAVTLLPPAALLMPTPATLADPPKYRIELLGPAGHVSGINESGVAVGSYDELGPNPTRAYVAGSNQTYQLLPLPAGYVSSAANDINDTGVIVGAASMNGYPNERGDGVVWTPNGQGGYDVAVLPHLPGHTGSVAKAINNRGNVIGQSIYDNSGFGPGVWFNSPDGIRNISVLIDAPTTVEDVNDNGLVIGFNGQMFDLDTLLPLPLPAGQLGLTGLYAVNSNDELAGGYGTGNSHGAVRWTNAFGWERIGLTGGVSADLWAFDINDSGVTVGETNLSYPWYFDVAVHFNEYGTLPLASLIESGQGEWVLIPAWGEVINNAGQIAVIAENLDTGESGVALLTPEQPTVEGDVNGDGHVDLTDLALLLASFGSCAGDVAFLPAADLDVSGCVELSDLAVLLANFGL